MQPVRSCTPRSLISSRNCALCATAGIGPGDNRGERCVVLVNAKKAMPETPASNRNDRRIPKRIILTVNLEGFTQAGSSRGFEYRRGCFRAAVSGGV